MNKVMTLNIQELNLTLIHTLKEWDPLGYGPESYETEIVDVVQAVHSMNHNEKLAKQIQGIYEFSFEEMIPMAKCSEMAAQLLRIKNSASCSL
ncbi:DUF1871 family protein [Falsibacillus pallidus]|uniref:Uncharacterized protein DUF1871 n=1 Tax=Falsibacillus pallidus TaxID=493781 RepID=A0A370FZM0_9BACI|nr:DUF1871 family protein [Falsibacillus pallidus]RDI36918.1 uncharacterized protein DUF1871 [Falsibacillus pallidus]